MCCCSLHTHQSVVVQLNWIDVQSLEQYPCIENVCEVANRKCGCDVERKIQFIRLPYPTSTDTKSRRWRLPDSIWITVTPQVVCPSGLRGGTQVAIASAAQVRTLPQLPSYKTFTFSICRANANPLCSVRYKVYKGQKDGRTHCSP